MLLSKTLPFLLAYWPGKVSLQAVSKTPAPTSRLPSIFRRVMENYDVSTTFFVIRGYPPLLVSIRTMFRQFTRTFLTWYFSLYFIAVGMLSYTLNMSAHDSRII
ncbi:MAG: hypothetical protein CV082_04740 [Candidatus Brocadia sp. BL1]|nr:MAG: hypothetical protein CV082_04740 [Candidatus Brocadia sp. BL1]